MDWAELSAQLAAAALRDQKALGEIVSEIAALKKRISDLEAVKVSGTSASASADVLSTSAVIAVVDGAAATAAAGAPRKV